MYHFRQLDNYSNIGKERVPFVEKGWVEFLVKLKGIKPVYLEISDESGCVIGCFTGVNLTLNCIINPQFLL